MDVKNRIMYSMENFPFFLLNIFRTMQMNIISWSIAIWYFFFFALDFEWNWNISFEFFFFFLILTLKSWKLKCGVYFRSIRSFYVHVDTLIWPADNSANGSIISDLDWSIWYVIELLANRISICNFVEEKIDSSWLLSISVYHGFLCLNRKMWRWVSLVIKSAIKNTWAFVCA